MKNNEAVSNYKYDKNNGFLYINDFYIPIEINKEGRK